MTYEPADFEEFLSALDAHPEWRERLRERVLGEEFLRLPMEVQELRAAVGTVADQLQRLAQRVADLGTKIDSLTDQVHSLAQQVAALAQSVEVHAAESQEYVGGMYELQFTLKGSTLFGGILRRPKVIPLEDVPGFDDLEYAGGYSQLELLRLRNLDLIVRGRDPRASSPVDVYLAIEISRTVDLEDIDRAVERAGLLARCGVTARPAVAGKFITPRAKRRAEESEIAVRLLHNVN